MDVIAEPSLSTSWPPPNAVTGVSWSDGLDMNSQALPLTPDGTSSSLSHSHSPPQAHATTRCPAPRTSRRRHKLDEAGAEFEGDSESNKTIRAASNLKHSEQAVVSGAKSDPASIELRHTGLAFLREWLHLSVIPTSNTVSPSSSPSTPRTQTQAPTPSRIPLLTLYASYTSTPLPPSVPICNIDAFLGCVLGMEGLIIEGPSSPSSNDVSASGSLDMIVEDDSTSTKPQTHTRSYTHVITNSILHSLSFDQLSGLWKSAGGDLEAWGRELIESEINAQRAKKERGGIKLEIDGEAGISPSSTPTKARSARKDPSITTNSPISSTTPSIPTTSKIANPATKQSKTLKSDKDLPDELFTVEIEADLPCPEASFRRVLRDEQLMEATEKTLIMYESDGPDRQKLMASKSKKAKAKASTKGSGADEMALGETKEAGRMAFCRQVVGEEGAKAVAAQWVKICIQLPTKSATGENTAQPVTLLDIFDAYEAYPHHPPGIPRVSKADVLRLVFDLYPIAGGGVAPVSIPTTEGAHVTENLAAQLQRSDPSTASTAMDTIAFRGVRLVSPISISLKDHVQIWQEIGFNFRHYNAKRLRAEARQVEAIKRNEEIALWTKEWADCRARGMEMTVEMDGEAGKDALLEGIAVKGARNTADQRKRKWIEQMRERERRQERGHRNAIAASSSTTVVSAAVQDSVKKRKRVAERIDAHMERIVKPKSDPGATPKGGHPQQPAGSSTTRNVDGTPGRGRDDRDHRCGFQAQSYGPLVEPTPGSSRASNIHVQDPTRNPLMMRFGPASTAASGSTSQHTQNTLPPPPNLQASARAGMTFYPRTTMMPASMPTPSPVGSVPGSAHTDGPHLAAGTLQPLTWMQTQPQRQSYSDGQVNQRNQIPMLTGWSYAQTPTASPSIPLLSGPHPQTNLPPMKYQPEPVVILPPARSMLVSDPRHFGAQSSQANHQMQMQGRPAPIGGTLRDTRDVQQGSGGMGYQMHEPTPLQTYQPGGQQIPRRHQQQHHPYNSYHSINRASINEQAGETQSHGSSRTMRHPGGDRKSTARHMEQNQRQNRGVKAEENDPVIRWLSSEYAFSPTLFITQRDLWLSFVRYITSLGPALSKGYDDIQPQALFQVVVGRFGCRVIKRGAGEYVIEGMGRRRLGGSVNVSG